MGHHHLGHLLGPGCPAQLEENGPLGGQHMVGVCSEPQDPGRSDGPRQTWHHHGNPPEAFSRRDLYIKGYWESPWTYQLGNQCLPPLQTFSSTLLGLEDSVQIFRQTSQAGLLVCQDVITHLLCAISSTFPLLGDLTMVGSKRCKCHQRHGYRLPNDWWLDLRPWIPRQESSVVVPNHHHSWGLPLGICRKGFISSDCCPWDVGHPPVGDLSHPTGTFFTPSATTCPHVRQPGQCLCASESTDPEDAYGSLSDAVGKPPIWSRSSTGTASLQTGSQPMGWRLNPSWSCRFHPWETTFSHSSVWSIHSFAADFTRLEDPQSPHQPKAVKELGRPYHSTHPWSPGESGGCGWTFLCGVDEILMTPPHITDSDLVHMMDLVWTSHTDKQQPHRQHLSWKRNAVACFGCCFTADLTSTYMFRAIFDCYGNTLINTYI